LVGWLVDWFFIPINSAINQHAKITVCSWYANIMCDDDDDDDDDNNNEDDDNYAKRQ